MTTQPEAGVRVLFDGMLTEPRLDHPECVAVARDGSLWCGGEAGQIFRIAEGRIELVATTGGFSLGLAFDQQGDLLVCDLARPAVWRYSPRTARIGVFAEGVAGHRLVAPNYPLVLPDGSLLVTDSGTRGTPRTGLLRFWPDGSGEVWLETPLDFANGLALSPGGDRVYVVETFASRILAVDIDATGRPAGEPVVHAELPGYLPDGLAVDANGLVYVGCYEPSAILRIEASGAVTELARDPTAHVLCHPTNLAFRGTELIASNLGRWHLSVLDAGVAGATLPPARR